MLLHIAFCLLFKRLFHGIFVFRAYPKTSDGRRPAANVAGFVPLPRHISPDIPRSRALPAPFSHGLWPAPEVSG